MKLDSKQGQGSVCPSCIFPLVCRHQDAICNKQCTFQKCISFFSSCVHPAETHTLVISCCCFSRCTLASCCFCFFSSSLAPSPGPTPSRAPLVAPAPETHTAHPQELLSFVGAAQAPSGYKILDRARVLRQMRTYRTSLVRRSFMPGTTRTGRDGSREGCMGATSTRVILRVLPQPIFLCDTASR